MNEQSRKALDAYYSDAASWNRDRVQSLRSALRVAWWIAGIAALVALMEGGSLLLLTPLKTVQPYTLLVDRTTGYVQALNPLEPAKIAPDTALTQSFLVQYVIARESFDPATIKTSYRKVALFSAGNARSSYIAGMQSTNPLSPLVVYPRGTLVETRVKSVSPMGRDAALVRFDTMRSDPGGGVQAAMSWAAVIRYRYSGEPMKLEDRFVNPLGFQVVGYRRDPEAVAPAVVAVPAQPTTAPTTTVPAVAIPIVTARPPAAPAAAESDNL
jgi:type IV secretion system protein VirB8